MNFSMILVILILIVALISTVAMLGKSDSDYMGSVKRNTKNLTVIYTVVIVLAFIAVAIYMRWFT